MVVGEPLLFEIICSPGLHDRNSFLFLIFLEWDALHAFAVTLV